MFKLTFITGYNARLRAIPQNKTYNEDFSTEGTPLISENSNDSSMHHQSTSELVEEQVQQDTSESHVSVDDSDYKDADFEVAPSSGQQQGGKRKNKKKNTRVS